MNGSHIFRILVQILFQIDAELLYELKRRRMVVVKRKAHHGIVKLGRIVLAILFRAQVVHLVVAVVPLLQKLIDLLVGIAIGCLSALRHKS